MAFPQVHLIVRYSGVSGYKSSATLHLTESILHFKLNLVFYCFKQRLRGSGCLFLLGALVVMPGFFPVPWWACLWEIGRSLGVIHVSLLHVGRTMNSCHSLACSFWLGSNEICRMHVGFSMRTERSRDHREQLCLLSGNSPPEVF